MLSLSYEDLHYFLDRILSQETIDLTWYDFIDPLYWTILKAEKDRRQKQNQNMDIKLDPLSRASTYSRYIFGHFDAETTVPIRTVRNRAQIDKFTQELVIAMRLDEMELDVEDQEFFKYIISELLTNAIDHGQSFAVVSAQRFPNLNEIEIAVVDTGLGFFHTIKRKHKVNSPSEAIKLAVQKNISGAIDYLYGGAQRNVGMGLYVISRIVKDAEGFMYIVSDDSIVKYTSSEEETMIIKNKWRGAIVMVRFNLKSFTKVLEYGFITYMKMIIGEDIEEEFF